MPKPNRVIRPSYVVPPFNPDYVQAPGSAFGGRKIRLDRDAYDYLAANLDEVMSKTLLNIFAKKSQANHV